MTAPRSDGPSPDPAEPDRRGDPRQRLGRHGEALATDFLRAIGLRVVATDLRTRHAQIDVLARERRTWVAVEVKTRRHGAPERAVTDAQLARLRRALLALAPALRPRPLALRIDVVAVLVDGDRPVDVRHFPGAPFVP